MDTSAGAVSTPGTPAAPGASSGPGHRVVTPVHGTVAPLDSVPDPRLASGAYGAGVAVVPDFGVEVATVVAPVAGEVCSIMPHYFLVLTDGGLPVYTQLGIDTDLLDGTGFSLHVSGGARGGAGQRGVTYAPGQLGRLGFDPVVSVGAVRRSSVTPALGPGEPCGAGDVLFEL
ncbi:PTS glucose transporter subunit IIA [Corynebacterium neomassiliense]|uniref:PTS glucose transporter subunit IIA n=1 Tax=Corynebacterium neomassiliense TaxID=2079482 RepID=UPI0010302935|nr:PTS glucose transporter subunit IIA [Corynebacterium neomassiliense]